MPTVALQQVTSAFARENAGKTLEKPIRLKYIEKFIEHEPKKLEENKSQCTDGNVFVWGAKLERIHQFIKMLPPRCLVLFRRGSVVYKCAVVTEIMVSLALAEYLWGTDTDGETWALVYFLKEVRNLSIPASEINQLVGRLKKDHWQGLVAVSSPAADQVIAYVKAELSKRSNNGVQGTPASGRP
jgi:hypothetical protein